MQLEHVEVAPAPDATEARAGSLRARYRALFSIHEIEQSRRLQWAFFSSLLSFFLTFTMWVHNPNATLRGPQRCWPHAEECGRFAFFAGMPQSYGQTLWYALVFAVLTGTAVLAVRRQWLGAHLGLWALFAFKLFVNYVQTHAFHGNFHIYHLVLTALLLFVPHKVYFSRRFFVVAYVLAGTVKLHPGWLLGTYFSALELGLPLFPDATIPLLTNGVIFLEFVMSWWLLSERVWLQRTALFAFLIFHIYSFSMVGFLYPTVCVPPLLIFFGGMIRNAPPPRGWRSVPGWLVLAAIVAMQLPVLAIRGDHRLTLEGSQLGLFMFEANHQCVSRWETHTDQGVVTPFIRESASAMARCYPYEERQQLQHGACRTPGVARVAWKLDHSINGGPFYRIVDEPNVCLLEYNLWRHNEWIRLPEDGAQVVGHAAKNQLGTPTDPGVTRVGAADVMTTVDASTGRAYFMLPGVFGNSPADGRSALQVALEPRVPQLTVAWLLVLIGCAVAGVLREVRRRT